MRLRREGGAERAEARWQFGLGLLGSYGFFVEPQWVEEIHRRIGVRGPGISIVRVTQVSDLHLQSFGGYEASLTARSRGDQPDPVVISGDAVDREEVLAGLHQPRRGHTPVGWRRIGSRRPIRNGRIALPRSLPQRSLTCQDVFIRSPFIAWPWVVSIACCVVRNKLHLRRDQIVSAQRPASVFRDKRQLRHTAKSCETAPDAVGCAGHSDDARGYRLPGFRLHPLSGQMRGRWSIAVNGNWRLTFEFNGNDVHVLDYEDYY